ncbi:hypothetical protein CSC43_6927 [Pseudomonas aeruginosa]|nr:hypothetical protein CSC43_6927 [Pseudomonas aeruginosa]
MSVWIATWMSWRSATSRQLSIAAGVLPQSRAASGRWRRRVPALQRQRQAGVALAGEADVHREGVGGWSIRAMCRDRRCSGGVGPGGGPVPPPIMW